jgi:hypothetical protein
MLAELFTLEHLTTFLILTALETVLGFDNLLYISIEAKRTGEKSEAYVRRMGIFLAIGLRIAAFVCCSETDRSVSGALSAFRLDLCDGFNQRPCLDCPWSAACFLIYTAMKEIHTICCHARTWPRRKRRHQRAPIASAFIWITPDEHRVLVRHSAFSGRPDQELSGHGSRRSLFRAY